MLVAKAYRTGCHGYSPLLGNHPRYLLHVSTGVSACYPRKAIDIYINGDNGDDYD